MEIRGNLTGTERKRNCFWRRIITVFLIGALIMSSSALSVFAEGLGESGAVLYEEPLTESGESGTDSQTEEPENPGEKNQSASGTEVMPEEPEGTGEDIPSEKTEELTDKLPSVEEPVLFLAPNNEAEPEEEEDRSSGDLNAYIETYIEKDGKTVISPDNIEVSGSLGRTEFLTGEEVNLSIGFTMNSFPDFSYDTGVQHSPVSYVKDAKVYFALPKGLLVTSLGDADMEWLTYKGKDEEENTWYCWNVTEDGAVLNVENGVSMGKTNIRVAASGNGTAAEGATFTIGKDMLVFSGKVDVLDYSKEEQQPEVYRPDVEINVYARQELAVTNHARNQWELRKNTVREGDFDYRIEEDQVIVRYEIEAGAPVSGDAGSGITRIWSDYNRYGTLDFQDYYIEDQIPVFRTKQVDDDLDSQDAQVSAAGKREVEPASVKVFWKDGGELALGTDYIRDGDTIRILAYNKTELTRKSNQDPKAEIPCYSAYLVELCYPLVELSGEAPQRKTVYEQTGKAVLHYMLKTEERERTSEGIATAVFESQYVQGEAGENEAGDFLNGEGSPDAQIYNYVQPVSEDWADQNLLTGKEIVRYSIGGSKKSDGTVGAFVLNNSMPLSAFTVKDEGLCLYDQEQTDHIAQGLAEEPYHISEITLGVASYQKHAMDTKETIRSITAEVKLKNKDGDVCTVTRRLGTKDRVIDTAAVWPGKKVASFTVTYYDEKLQQEHLASAVEGAVVNKTLGSNFTAEPIQVKAELEQQAEGQEIEQVRRVVNAAGLDVSYLQSNQAGAYTEEQVIVPDTSAEVLLKPAFHLPKVMLSQERTVNGKPVGDVKINQEIAYETHIKNMDTDRNNFANPIFIDTLPDHVALVIDEEGSPYSFTGPDRMKADSTKSGLLERDGKRYLNICFNGELEPGEEMVITVRVKALPDIVEDPNHALKNRVSITSAEAGIVWSGNEDGISFVQENGALPEKNPELDQMLGLSRSGGYLHADDTLRISGESGVQGQKYIRKDAGESWTGMDTAVRVRPEEELHYRLIVSNLNDSVLDKVRIADILPQAGDQSIVGQGERGSVWAPRLTKISSMKLYTYVEEREEYQERALTRDKDFELYISRKSPSVISGSNNDLKKKILRTSDIWEKVSGSSALSDNVTGLMIDFNSGDIDPDADNVTLNKYDYLEVIYNVKVPEDEELTAIQYDQPAVNDFTYYTWQQNQQLEDADALDSSSVKAIVTRDNVSVGGHIWIDENRNGLRDDGVLVTGVDQIPEIEEVELYSYHGGKQTGNMQTAKVGENVGERCKEFRFDNLFYAVYSAENEEKLYDPVTKELVPAYLEGDGVNYKLVISIPEGYQVTKRFESNQGLPNRSENPDRKYPAGYDLDSNFQANLIGNRGESERFFLWPAQKTDMTKDLGLTRDRTIRIELYDRDTGEAVKGTKFTLYGPFEPNETIDLKDIKVFPVAAKGETDGQGVLEFSGLNYYEDYLLVETQASPEYTTDGMTVSVDENGDLSDWITEYPTDGNTAYRLRANLDDADTKLTLHVKNRYVGGFNLRIKKVDGENPGKALQGASFRLVPAQVTEGTDGMPDIWKPYLNVGSISVVSDKNGIADFGELMLLNYLAYEEEAPEHYEKLTEPIRISQEEIIRQLAQNQEMICTIQVENTRNSDFEDSDDPDKPEKMEKPGNPEKSEEPVKPVMSVNSKKSLEDSLESSSGQPVILLAESAQTGDRTQFWPALAGLFASLLGILLVLIKLKKRS